MRRSASASDRTAFETRGAGLPSGSSKGASLLGAFGGAACDETPTNANPDAKTRNQRGKQRRVVISVYRGFFFASPLATGRTSFFSGLPPLAFSGGLGFSAFSLAFGLLVSFAAGLFVPADFSALSDFSLLSPFSGLDLLSFVGTGAIGAGLGAGFCAAW